MDQTFYTVKSILEDVPSTRDDDCKLISMVWAKEVTKNGMATSDFLSELSEGNFTTPETITRSRRAIQERCPDLRGTKYQERQAHSHKYHEQFTFWNLFQRNGNALLET